MDYKDGRANGMWSGWNRFPAEFTAKIRAMIPGLREEARAAVLARGEIGRAGEFEFGYRFKDDEIILARAMSGLAELSLGAPGIFRSNVPEVLAVPAVSDETLKNYVIAAYLDAASADHWYTYEKDWGV